MELYDCGFTKYSVNVLLQITSDPIEFCKGVNMTLPNSPVDAPLAGRWVVGISSVIKMFYDGNKATAGCMVILV